MMRHILIVTLLVSACTLCGQAPDTADWESLDRYPTPQGWREAKFGNMPCAFAWVFKVANPRD